MAGKRKPFPLIASARLRFRCLDASDAQTWYEQITHPEVARFYGGPDSIERKSRIPAAASVFTGPAEMAFTRIFFWPMSQAR